MWTEKLLVVPRGSLTVAVEMPATARELPMSKVMAWLERSGTTPRELATKVTLRGLMGA